MKNKYLFVFFLVFMVILVLLSKNVKNITFQNNLLCYRLKPFVNIDNNVNSQANSTILTVSQRSQEGINKSPKSPPNVNTSPNPTTPAVKTPGGPKSYEREKSITKIKEMIKVKSALAPKSNKPEQEKEKSISQKHEANKSKEKVLKTEIIQHGVKVSPKEKNKPAEKSAMRI